MRCHTACVGGMRSCATAAASALFGDLLSGFGLDLDGFGLADHAEEGEDEEKEDEVEHLNFILLL